MGFLYLPDVRPTAPSNRVGTSEYANIVFHALDDYAPALAAGMPPLDGKRMWVLQSWARRILTGDWTHAGYLNWDTGLAYRRWHLTRYWVFALGGLSTLAEAPVLDDQERRWARWMFDRALGYYERLQAGRHTPAIPSTLYGDPLVGGRPEVRPAVRRRPHRRPRRPPGARPRGRRARRAAAAALRLRPRQPAAGRHDPALQRRGRWTRRSGSATAASSSPASTTAAGTRSAASAATTAPDSASRSRAAMAGACSRRRAAIAAPRTFQSGKPLRGAVHARGR